MSITRRNHYVPKWYQKRFLVPGQSKLWCLDLFPEKRSLPDGSSVTLNSLHCWTPQQCFYQDDLYTTSFFGFANDEIERYLFGTIDKTGSEALRAVMDNDVARLHDLFHKFFEFMDAQKIRTPKGLDWIKTKYAGLTQLELMLEMQQIRQMHCTMWVEAVREIVSAEETETKFIITDHPVTIYNSACSLSGDDYTYPSDPAITLNGSQTIYPLDLDHCLILSNLDYAKNPHSTDLLAKRIHARHFGETISRIDTMIRSRKLSDSEVKTINYILKMRARKYVVAGKKEWLCPEAEIKNEWSQLGQVLLPPKDELYHFGGEIYVGYKDGTTHYQDAYGRTLGELSHLKKPPREGKVGANDPCVCGSGKKYKKCCRGKDPAEMAATDVLSIRERNLIFFRIITDILGLGKKGKSWDDVRRELNDKHVQDIHKAFEGAWPKETNIIDLLPRPDHRVLRALYTGLIDPRTIIQNVISFSIYFDEILLVNPFTNPTYVKPEYNPVHSPRQYKQETLKNVLLFHQLIPFVEAGFVNIIPDPCSIDLYLQKEIWKMAEARHEIYKLRGWKPNHEDARDMEKLVKDDLQRTMTGLPEESQRRQVKKALPNLSIEEVDALIAYMQKQRLKDPLALLQPISPGIDEGQLTISHLSPNLELGLFLAQITGSLLYTDNAHRWMEITDTSAQFGNGSVSLWQPLETAIKDLVLSFEVNTLINLRIRKEGRLSSVRNTLRRIFAAVQSEHDPTRIHNLCVSLSKELNESLHRSEKEWAGIEERMKEYAGDDIRFVFKRKIDSLLPANGISLNTVYRLLLHYGTPKCLKHVPMGILVKQDQ